MTLWDRKPMSSTPEKARLASESPSGVVDGSETLVQRLGFARGLSEHEALPTSHLERQYCSLHILQVPDVKSLIELSQIAPDIFCSSGDTRHGCRASGSQSILPRYWW